MHETLVDELSVKWIKAVQPMLPQTGYGEGADEKY